MFQIFGLEPQSVTPTRQLVLDATHPADLVRRETGVAGLLANRCSATLEHRIVRPDKTVRHIRTTVAFASCEGERQRIVGSVQDVTSEHRIARTMAGRAAVSGHKALDEWGAFDEGLMAGFAAAIHLCVGVLWVPRHDTLMAMRIWHEPSSSLGALVAATRLWRPGRASPIVGRAWTNRYPVVSNNPTAGASPELAGALQDAGSKAAIAIPAVVDDEALAVLEFLSFERIEPRAHKLRSLDGVGHEIGAFLGHLRGELCPPLLTPRQIKVLQLAAHAVSASDIAREMHLSPPP